MSRNRLLLLPALLAVVAWIYAINAPVSSSAETNLTIDKISLSSSSPKPTLSGTYSGIQHISLSIKSKQGTGAVISGSYLNEKYPGEIKMAGGKWEFPLHRESLTSGELEVEVKEVNFDHPGPGGVKVSGTLVIASPSSWPACDANCYDGTPVIYSVSPAKGPPLTKVTVTGRNFTKTIKIQNNTKFSFENFNVSDDGKSLSFVIAATVPDGSAGSNGYIPKRVPTPAGPIEFNLGILTSSEFRLASVGRFEITN
jgi:hypothetical protein